MAEVGNWCLTQLAPRNLGVILRMLFRLGAPRGWCSVASSLRALFGALVAVLIDFWLIIADFGAGNRDFVISSMARDIRDPRFHILIPSSAGCSASRAVSTSLSCATPFCSLSSSCCLKGQRSSR